MSDYSKKPIAFSEQTVKLFYFQLYRYYCIPCLRATLFILLSDINSICSLLFPFCQYSYSVEIIFLLLVFPKQKLLGLFSEESPLCWAITWLWWQWWQHLLTEFFIGHSSWLPERWPRSHWFKIISNKKVSFSIWLPLCPVDYWSHVAVLWLCAFQPHLSGNARRNNSFMSTESDDEF